MEFASFDLNNGDQKASNGSQSGDSDEEELIRELSQLNIHNERQVEQLANTIKKKRTNKFDVFNTTEIRQELFAMLRVVNCESIGSTVEICSIAGWPIEKRGFCSLYGNSWVENSIVNAYLQMIVDGHWPLTESRIYAYKHEFFEYVEMLSDGLQMKMMPKEGLNPFSFNIVFIPVLKKKELDGEIKGTHWMLIVIRMDKKVVELYDSLLGDYPEILEEIKAFLGKEAEEHKVAFEEDDWKFEQKYNIPEQKNTQSCGVFVCKYGEYIARGVEFDFHDQSMSFGRSRMQFDILKYGKIGDKIQDNMQSTLDKFHKDKSKVRAVPRAKSENVSASKVVKRKARRSTSYATRPKKKPRVEKFVEPISEIPTNDSMVADSSEADFEYSLPMGADIVYAAYLDALMDPSFDAVSPDTPPVESLSAAMDLQMITSEATYSPCCSCTPHSGGYFSTDDCAQSPVEQSSLTNGANFSCANSQLSNTLESSSYVKDAKSNASPTVAQTPAAFIARTRNGPKTVDDYLAELPTYAQPDKHFELKHRRMELLYGQSMESIHDRNTLLEPNSKVIGKYKIGDLVWAKAWGFAYWPGMILVDPFSPKGVFDGKPIFAKTNVGGRVTDYHVQFFGDEQFRVWVPTSKVDHYIPHARLKVEVIKPQIEALYYAKDKAKFVKGERIKKMAIWTGAIAEADQMVRLSNEERIKFTYEYVERGTFAKRAFKKVISKK